MINHKKLGMIISMERSRRK